MMKTRFAFILIILIAFSLQSNAQLLWQISGNGLEKPSYLFGTHHIAPVSICDSIAGFEEAFNSCSQLYGELDMKNMEEMSEDFAKSMMLPQDSLLDKFYTPEEYKLLDSIIKNNLGISIDQMKMLKPAALSAQLTLIINQQTFKDFNPHLPIDIFLQKRAREKGLPVKGFETMQFQIEILFGAPLTKQAKDLLKIIQHFDKMKMYVAEMCDTYLRQDLDNLLNTGQDPVLGFTQEEMDRLIYNRNRDWSKQLKEILPQQPTFIVVGACHLPGQEGLIDLLRKQGYTLSPIW